MSISAARRAIPLIAGASQSSGGAHLFQVARAGRLARRLCARPRRADRGAVAGQEQLQFLSARPHRPGRRHRLGRGRSLFPARACKTIVAERETHDRAPAANSASTSCRQAPISSSRATEAPKARSSPRALRDRAVLVRHFNAPRIEDFLRITIGTAEQTEKLVAALREILALTARSCSNSSSAHPPSSPGSARP